MWVSEKPAEYRVPKAGMVVKTLGGPPYLLVVDTQHKDPRWYIVYQDTGEVCYTFFSTECLVTWLNEKHMLEFPR